MQILEHSKWILIILYFSVVFHMYGIVLIDGEPQTQLIWVKLLFERLNWVQSTRQWGLDKRRQAWINYHDGIVGVVTMYTFTIDNFGTITHWLSIAIRA